MVVDKRSYEYKLSYAMLMCIWEKCEKVNLLERNGRSVSTLPTMRKVIKSCYFGWFQMPQIGNLWYKSAGEWYHKHSWISIQIKHQITILICLFFNLLSKLESKHVLEDNSCRVYCIGSLRRPRFADAKTERMLWIIYLLWTQRPYAWYGQ